MERGRRDGVEESQTTEVAEEDDAHAHDGGERVVRDAVVCLKFP